MKTSTMDTIGTASAKASGIAGVFTPVLSFLTNSETLALLGLAFTVLTFLMSLYYKARSDRRAEAIARHKEEEHQLRMEMLRHQRGHVLIDPVSDIPTEIEADE